MIGLRTDLLAMAAIGLARERSERIEEGNKQRFVRVGNCLQTQVCDLVGGFRPGIRLWLEMCSRILFLIGLLALAHLSPARAMLWSNVAASEDNPPATGDADQGTTREFQFFREARVSLRRAIKIAEKLHSGSTALEVRFDILAGSAVYWVKTMRRTLIWENAIDAKTGSVARKESTLSLESSDNRNELVALKNVRQELSDAVAIAEKVTKGNAISATLMKRDGRLNFIILIVSGDQLREVILEPPTARRP
ncbi:hypothetical protein ASG57_16255 [Bradyrhizobium sp. Leaf396]|jgi:uncharacterized membrane protein YkoI|nr:hypothetical protein ASG57_16255 [Bradyrhizobium sp. Leaf396]